MTTRKAGRLGGLGQSVLGVSILCQGVRRLLDQQFECFRFVYGEIGQDLAIKINAGFDQAIDKPGVGHPVTAGGGVDPLDPQGTEGAFLRPAVAIGILQPLLDLFDGDAERGGGATAVTGSAIENLFMTGVGGDARFLTRAIDQPP